VRGSEESETPVGGPGATGAAAAIAVVLSVVLVTPARAQTPAAPGQALTPAAVAPPAVTFDEAVSAAVQQNLTVQITATNVLRAEALLQQIRAATLPFVNAAAVNSTLDAARGFDDNIVQPQNQWTLSASAGVPVLAAARWAARAQQADRVAIERLNTIDVQRQVAVSAATAYLAVINQKRLVDVQVRSLETARAQLDYNRKRLEGGIGSRLNALRAAQIVSTEEALVELFRLNVQRAQEALGVLINADGPRDAGAEPAFEVPVIGAPEDWLPQRPDYRLFGAERNLAERVVRESSREWWPTATVSFDPAYVTPAGLFQPSGTWRLTVNVAQPVYDGGLRRGLRREREASLQASELALQQLALQARAEVRTARAAVEYQERALANARAAAGSAAEVLKITIIAFDAGASTNIEVIDAQRSARDLETAVAQAEDRVRQARLDLLVALGRFPKP
jgi:outer membrane protein TolC